MRKLLSAVAALVIGGCSASGGPALSPSEQAVLEIEQRLAGNWRLTSYVPEQTLSPAMLFALQADRLAVTFQGGHVRSASPSLQFDRKYRIADPGGDRFRVFIADDTGIEYESWCAFEQDNKILFDTKTEPWKGRGVLERERGAPRW